MGELKEKYTVLTPDERRAQAIAAAGFEIIDNPSPQRRYSIYWQFPEFTSLCPRTGYPDFATVHIWWVPYAAIVELKSLKLWLNSFRDKGHYHEEVTALILDTLVAAVNPHWMRITMDFTPRGNLYTGVTAVHNPENYRPEFEIPRLPGPPAWRPGAT